MPLNPMKSSPMNSKTAKSERTVNYREVCRDSKAPHTPQESKHPEVCRDSKAPHTPQESKHPESHSQLPKEDLPNRQNPKRKFISPKSVSQICTFNVNSNLNQERQVLLSSLMAQKEISMIGLTETNKTGKGDNQVVYPMNDNTPCSYLYWSGHDSDKRKKTGVALLLSADANDCLIDYDTISDRLIRARFRAKQCRLTVFVAYAPHSSHTKTDQNAFWSSLSSELR